MYTIIGDAVHRYGSLRYQLFTTGFIGYMHMKEQELLDDGWERQLWKFTDLIPFKKDTKMQLYKVLEGGELEKYSTEIDLNTKKDHSNE